MFNDDDNGHDGCEGCGAGLCPNGLCASCPAPSGVTVGEFRFCAGECAERAQAQLDADAAEREVA